MLRSAGRMGIEMIAKSVGYLMAAGGLWLASGQAAPRVASLPADPLELATGPTRVAKTPIRRAATLRLVDRARQNYTLRGAAQAYDLKVTFLVNSGGRTAYDGPWQMEDVFDPGQGLRWTASGPNAYRITRIAAHGMLYGDDTGSYVPLRLHEARAALFNPIPSAERAAGGSIRTTDGIFDGAQLTCVLLSAAGRGTKATPGRHWDETEDCIDPQSGLLQVHSQVPGRYYAYDYTDAPSLGGHMLPRKVTVTEAGRVVTEISVESVTPLPSADPSLFVPTEEMKSRGRAITLAEAQKIRRVSSAAIPSAVCIFGLVTPSGQLVEAHSLQPSDPNSAAALDAARRIDFSNQPVLGPEPQQRFLFLIEEFSPSR
jgi:hypothetical protein